jgi:beta-glucosidase
VAGRGADDLGLQCGGWTIDWQGGLGPITPGGTTLLAALRARAAAAGVETTYAADGTGAQGADVAIVVVAESPYAEFEGDDAELTLSEEDRQVVERVRATGVPLALVVLSGRPLALGEALDASSAVVAAWLPGTEGAGVADVLFGDAAPTGKLSFSWPRSGEQHPLNAGDAKYEPQFPLGHGLTWPVE